MRTFNWDSIPSIAKVGTDPAVEIPPSDPSYVLTVPTGKRWRLEGAKMGLVASADAANRTMQLIITDGTDIVFGTVQGLVITAGQTKTQTWVRMSLNTTPGLQFGIHFPDLELLAGWKVYVYITNFDTIAAGDNATALTVWIKEAPA